MSHMSKTLRLLVLLGLLLQGACKKEEFPPIDSYVVMVSMDGYRWDYPRLYETPQLDDMAVKGVKAARLIPSFPTKTFPNHYSLATGLYPDHHGIINNTFYANDLDRVYRIGDRDMVMNGESYFGEPIWVTAEKQGMRTASYFWVGSEAPIQGIRPTYWRTYDGAVPYEKRVEQVIDWLSMPMRKRPAFITLYFDEPDHTSHGAGPEHPDTEEVVESLDALLGILREEIAALDISDRVNLVVLSDHGMGALSPERYVDLEKHLPSRWLADVWGGNPVYLLDPEEGKGDSICLKLNQVEGVSGFQREGMPSHLHYGTSSRFPGVVVVADSLWSLGWGPAKQGSYSGGAHGYDPQFSQMHTIFYAEGPAFRQGYERPPFENVEVYGILAHILGLEPVETDGELSRVSDLFVQWQDP